MGRLAGQKPPIKNQSEDSPTRFPPTEEMQSNAQEGLALQQEYGRGESKHRLIRAHKIAKGQPLTETDWRSIARYQAGYYGDEAPIQNPNVNYSDGGPDARYIASLMLGGRAGQEEAFNVVPNLLG